MISFQRSLLPGRSALPINTRPVADRRPTDVAAGVGGEGARIASRDDCRRAGLPR